MLESTAAERTLDDLVAQIESNLEPGNLHGAYLYGSLARGGFVEGNSDLDLLVVLVEPAGPNELLRLRRMHETFELSHAAWRDRIEVQYVAKDALATFRTEPYAMAVISPGEKFHAITAGADWMQNWYDVQQCGRILRGPAATTLFPRISADEFVAAIRVYVAEHRERANRMTMRRGAQAYAILTMCRALFTCQTRRQVTKSDAALWAVERFPEWREVIESAVEVHRGPKVAQYVISPGTAPAAKAFVTFAAGMILD